MTDGSRKLVGVVSLRALVLAKDTAEPIRDLMDTNVVSVTTTTDQEDVSHLFENTVFWPFRWWTPKTGWWAS